MRNALFAISSLAYWICGCVLGPAVTAGAGELEFATERVVGPGSLDRPVFLTAPPNDAERVFILEQHTGEIRIMNLSDWTLNATPFLTIPGISTTGEQGLLGLAFHPDYAVNKQFYVNYTRSAGDTVIARYATSTDPDIANPTETVIGVVGQPQANHNGGWIGFSPDDGFLYVAIGDGGNFNDAGAGHDPDIGNGQDIDSLLGKILRLDIDGDDFPQDANRNYAIPNSNPFVGVAGRDEIWAYGLRNPYRASFDRQTGDLYIGDVGQDTREEVDVLPSLDGGHNLGWRLREGTIDTPTGGVGGPAPPGAIDPIFDYSHGNNGFEGFAVVGGVVYRGPIPSLRGAYFFGDFVTGRLWSLRFDGSDPSAYDGTNFTDLIDHTLRGDPEFIPDAGSFSAFTAFGEDLAGNLYILKLGDDLNNPATDSGEIFRVPEPAAFPLAATAALSIAVLRRRSTEPR